MNCVLKPDEFNVLRSGPTELERYHVDHSKKRRVVEMADAVNQAINNGIEQHACADDDEDPNEECAADGEDIDTTNKNGSSRLVFKCTPLQGFHMPSSFKHRLWMSVEHIHYGTELVKTLFGSTIFKNKLYPDLNNNIEEQFLAFLFQMTADCATRGMYNAVLGRLCIHISTVHDITRKVDFIEKCVSDPSGINQLAQTYANRYDTSAKADIIVGAFNTVTKASIRTIKYSSCTDEMKYQCIRSVIFSKFLQFKPQEELKKMVALKRGASSSKIKRSTRNKCTNDQHRFSFDTLGTSSTTNEVQQAAAIVHCELPSLSSQLLHITPFVILGEADLNTGIEDIVVENNVVSHIAVPSYESMLNDESRWENCCIANGNKLKTLVCSTLVIDTPDIMYHLEAAPVEIYSAGNLVRHEHWRTNTLVSKLAKEDHKLVSASVYIPPGQVQHFDRNDILHVVRPESPLFKRNAENLNGSLLKVMKFVMRHGSLDASKKKPRDG